MNAFVQRLPGIVGALGVLSLLVSAGAYLVFSEPNRWVLTTAAVGIVLIIYAILEKPQLITGSMTGREAKYGSNTLVMTATFIGILVLINFMASRYYHRWDLTQNQEFSLSEQTVKIVEALPAPVKVTSFYQENQPGKEDLEQLLKEYRRYNNQIEVEFIDPDLRPGVAREYKIELYGTTVFESAGRRQTVSGASEAEVTSALLKLTRDEAKKVYFLAGHGELDLDGFDRNGASEAKRLLELENYHVEPLVLTTVGQVPADAAVVVVAGAQNKLLPDELSALQTYLDDGGKVLLLIEPRSPGNPTDFLAEWGIDTGDGVVVDVGQNLQNDPLTPVILRYAPNPIMKGSGADARLLTAFPAATTVNARPDIDPSLIVTTIAETSDRSWLETDERTVQFDADKDVPGPFPLAVAVTKADPEGKSGGRLVVIGNANFMTNALLIGAPLPGNRDLFLNSIGWLAEEEDLLAVRAKVPTDRSLLLTGTEQNLLFFSSTVFLPLAILLIGGYVWWTRR
ncbi:MAG TPA: GldG family protein [Chloroflexota bacterium]|nr:GldG family protein [Chloroflexota bacterium]